MTITWKEFRKKYAWTLKNYHGTSELYRDNFYTDLIGKMIEKKCEKRGKKWFLVSEAREDVTPAFYFNTVDAVTWFRERGGYERVICGYCVRGYVPLEIISINPDKTEKTVRTFKLF